MYREAIMSTLCTSTNPCNNLLVASCWDHLQIKVSVPYIPNLLSFATILIFCTVFYTILCQFLICFPLRYVWTICRWKFKQATVHQLIMPSSVVWLKWIHILLAKLFSYLQEFYLFSSPPLQV